MPQGDAHARLAADGCFQPRTRHVHHKLTGLFCDECFQWGPASPQYCFQKSVFIELDLVVQTTGGFHESMHAVLTAAM